MSMLPFLLHVRQCAVCRAHPRTPCATGWELFNESAHVLARTYDLRRAKA